MALAADVPITLLQGAAIDADRAELGSRSGSVRMSNSTEPCAEAYPARAGLIARRSSTPTLTNPTRVEKVVVSECGAERETGPTGSPTLRLGGSRCGDRFLRGPARGLERAHATAVG